MFNVKKLCVETKTTKISHKSRMKTFALTFTLLMLASAFLVFSPSETKTASAQTTSIPSNLLQYEWTSSRASPSGSFVSAGPAPTSPNIQWKALSGHGMVSGLMAAFNGMVFAHTLGDGGTVALNAATGAIVWIAKGVGAPSTGVTPGAGPAICKINNDYMLIGTTCVYIANGTTAWVGPTGFGGPASSFSGAGYVPELKMLFDSSNAWDMSDPSKPPTLVWSIAGKINGGAGGVVYGDGKLFVGCADTFLRAYDATTGALLWQTPDTTDLWTYGMSYGDGLLFHGALDGNMRCWNATTGTLLWTYNPHTFYNFWASSTSYAYGMVYELNQDAFLYAINGTTGQLVWRAKGPGVAYQGEVMIADGKAYATVGSTAYRDPATGESAAPPSMTASTLTLDNSFGPCP